MPLQVMYNPSTPTQSYAVIPGQKPYGSAMAIIAFTRFWNFVILKHVSEGTLGGDPRVPR
jgi:hypothetical protein